MIKRRRMYFFLPLVILVIMAIYFNDAIPVYANPEQTVAVPEKSPEWAAFIYTTFIIARIVNKYVGWSMGRTMFLFDFIVITTSVFVILELNQGMYTLVAVYIGARVIDFLQEGAYSAKGTMIISNRSDELAKTILTKMDRGVTVLDGRGSFSGEKREVLYCIVARNEIVHLKSIINQIDPHAFVSVTTVHDVLGEGFTLDENKNPLREQ